MGIALYYLHLDKCPLFQMWLLLKLCKVFLGMDWTMRIEFHAEAYDYLFVTLFIPTLVYTQPPIQ
jgi:hypothetical protein